MFKSALAAIVLAFAFMAAPAFGQAVTVPADTPVVVVDEPVVITEPVVFVEEPTTWDTIKDILISAVMASGGGLILLVTAYVWKSFPGLGNFLGDQGRDRVNEILRNGLFWLAEQQKKGLKKNVTPAEGAVEYGRMHGLDAKLKKLGDDPRSAATQAAMEARVGKMLADPAVVTPPEMTPPGGKPAVSAVLTPSA